MDAKRIVAMLLSAGLLAILAPVVGTRVSLAGASAQGQVMEGAWSLTTTFANGQQVSGLVTYNSDGSLILTTSNPLASIGHGAWVRTGNREFATTWVGLRFDQDRNVIGTQKLRSQLTLNETLDAFSTRFQTELLDQAGNVVGSNSGTSQGSRIRVEPLN